jgi:hypothetical protein
MDWETLLGITGIYVLLLGASVHHWAQTRRIVQVTETNNKIVSLIGDVVAARLEREDKKKDLERLKRIRGARYK